MVVDSAAWTGARPKRYLPTLALTWVTARGKWSVSLKPLTYGEATTYTLQIRRHVGNFYDYRWVRDYDFFRCAAYPKHPTKI